MKINLLVKPICFLILLVSIIGCKTNDEKPVISDEWTVTTVDGNKAYYKAFKGIDDKSQESILEVVSMPERKMAIRIYTGNGFVNNPKYLKLSNIQDGYSSSCELVDVDGYFCDPLENPDPTESLYSTLTYWRNTTTEIVIKNDSKDVLYEFKNVSLKDLPDNFN